MGQQQVRSLKETLEQIRAEQSRLAQLEEHFQLVIGYYESAGDLSKPESTEGMTLQQQNG